jgi:hypothetical protein
VNAAEWIATAQPQAPERLVARVREVLATPSRTPSPAVADALIDAADLLLRDVLAETDGPARDKALDLLAADACVTWAFEAAAEDPASLGGRAAATMERLARVVVR